MSCDLVRVGWPKKEILMAYVNNDFLALKSLFT
jgi:hypothetical protein